MNNTQDEIVRELLHKVSEKKEAIEQAEKPVYFGKSMFGYREDGSDKKPLHVLTNIEDVVNFYAFILMKNSFHQQSAQELGMKLEFKWLGTSFSHWKADLQTKANVIQITKRKEELAVLEDRLQKLVSPEERRRIELEELQKLLKNME